MKKAINSTIAFSWKLFLLLLASFSIHELIHYWKKIEFSAYLIQEAYITNFLMVVVSYFALLAIKEKNNQAVGFIFLGGFFIKLIVFLKFFNPIYKEDSYVEPAEFAAFFVPYALCLAMETTSLVRLLNRS